MPHRSKCITWNRAVLMTTALLVGLVIGLVIRQQSGLPRATGAILYQQRTDMAPFEKDAVFFDVGWESSKQSPTIPSPDATRTWWYSIALDHP